ncbi:MAG: hypothetical protein DSY90_07330 [Deltaproteobacteria bacterium]|nr:MAG: hypothetical protein DSY90_07330 [Deltaproteobacteria bacterium]
MKSRGVLTDRYTFFMSWACPQEPSTLLFMRRQPCRRHIPSEWCHPAICKRRGKWIIPSEAVLQENRGMSDITNAEVKRIAGGVALVLALFGMAVYLPIIGFFFALFIPLPIWFYHQKLGPRRGLTVTAIAAVVMYIIIGRPGVDLIFFSELLFIGILLSRFSEKKMPVEIMVGMTCLLVLASGTAGLIFYSFTLGRGIGSIVSAYVTQNLELTMALYKSAGMSEDTIRMLTESLDQIHYILVRITPALVSATTLLVIWANLIAARPLFLFGHLPFPATGPLNQWRAPELLIWLLIACGGMLLIPSGTLHMIGLNGLIVLVTIYFFQGIAIVSFYFNKKNFSKAAKILFYGLIVVQQLLLFVVIGLGLFDVWLDFRRLDKKTE